MQKFNPEWSMLDRVDYLQTKVIKMSMAYYEYDFNFVSDPDYDALCFQLVDLQKNCPDVHLSRFWYMMYDFDGSTGCDLYERLTDEDREWLDYVVGLEMNYYSTKASRVRKRPASSKKAETSSPAPKKKKKGRLF